MSLNGEKKSINSIAKELGVSITTVSFVLNGKGKEQRISEELEKKIIDYVRDIGYKPNFLAKSLRTGKTNTIGLIVENISNPFFSTIAREIEEKAYQHGYKIIYSSTENNPEKTIELINVFSDRHIDGYIIVPPGGVDKEINDLINMGKPVVLLDRCLEHVATDYVVVNNFESTYQATMRLIDDGLENIAFITLNSRQSQMLARLEGYRKAINDHGIQEIIKEVPYERSKQAFDDFILFFEERKEIDAAFFATNYLGLSGLKALKKINIKIPKQMSVICFDDYELFDMHTPSISSIMQPIESIAENAINLLLSRLEGKKGKRPQNIVLPTSFIKRESSN